MKLTVIVLKLFSGIAQTHLCLLQRQGGSSFHLLPVEELLVGGRHEVIALGFTANLLTTLLSRSFDILVQCRNHVNVFDDKIHRLEPPPDATLILEVLEIKRPIKAPALPQTHPQLSVSAASLIEEWTKELWTGAVI